VGGLYWIENNGVAARLFYFVNNDIVVSSSDSRWLSRQPTEYLVQLARAYQQGAGGNHLRFIYHEISKVEPSTIVLG
jgi:hypothetical protein